MCTIVDYYTVHDRHYINTVQDYSTRGHSDRQQLLQLLPAVAVPATQTPITF